MMTTCGIITVTRRAASASEQMHENIGICFFEICFFTKFLGLVLEGRLRFG